MTKTEKHNLDKLTLFSLMRCLLNSIVTWAFHVTSLEMVRATIFVLLSTLMFSPSITIGVESFSALAFS